MGPVGSISCFCHSAWSQRFEIFLQPPSASCGVEVYLCNKPTHRLCGWGCWAASQLLWRKRSGALIGKVLSKWKQIVVLWWGGLVQSLLCFDAEDVLALMSDQPWVKHSCHLRWMKWCGAQVNADSTKYCFKFICKIRACLFVCFLQRKWSCVLQHLYCCIGCPSWELKDALGKEWVQREADGASCVLYYLDSFHCPCITEGCMLQSEEGALFNVINKSEQRLGKNSGKTAAGRKEKMSL